MPVRPEAARPDLFLRMPIQPPSQLAPFLRGPRRRLRNASRQLGRSRDICGQCILCFFQKLVHPMDPMAARWAAGGAALCVGAFCADAIQPGLGRELMHRSCTRNASHHASPVHRLERIHDNRASGLQEINTNTNRIMVVMHACTGNCDANDCPGVRATSSISLRWQNICSRNLDVLIQ